MNLIEGPSRASGTPEKIVVPEALEGPLKNGTNNQRICKFIISKRFGLWSCTRLA